MAVIPSQERYVDPYADIFSNIVNHRLMSVYPTGKGIIKGLWLDVGDPETNLLIVHSGIALKDFVTLNIAQTTIDVSSMTDGTYYVVLEYTYEVASPPPQATIDIVSLDYDGDGLILGKVTITSGAITGIDYADRSRNALMDHLQNLMSTGQIQNDIDINGYRIINLGSEDPSVFTDETDAVNKAYVDYVLTNVATDIHVKVDDEDSEADFLSNKIVVGDNLSKDIRNEDLSPATSGSKHVLLISGVDDKISVITGDSTSSVLDDKIEVQNPLYKYVVDGSAGKALQLKLHYDGEASSGSSEHNGQKTILTDNFVIGGETVLALYVADIFVHKTGSMDESITGNKTFQGNVVIQGDLTVEGTTTTVNTQELTVEDNIITLNSNLTSGTPPDTLISGIEVSRGDEPKAKFYWKESIDRWQFEEPLNVHSVYFDYPGSNTDTLSFTRVDIASDKSVLRTIIGDNTSGDDYFEIGSLAGGWTSLFKVYNNGNVWIKGNTDIEGNLVVNGTINGVTIGSAGTGSGLDADTLDGYDSSYFANHNLSNVSDNVILNKLKNVDGSGSGLDADLLDGHDSSYFAVASHNHDGRYVKLTDYEDRDVLNKIKHVDGPGSGLNADLLDGYHANHFAVAGHHHDDRYVKLTDYENGDVLNKIKHVDGSGSGLDADLLDGLHAGSFLRRDTNSSPTTDNAYDLGDTSHRWKNIHAVYFQGTAVRAQYADLAENYTTKDSLSDGDVVLISMSLEYDCEKSNEINSHRVLGVVSKNPAIVMDSELESGVAVALKGKVKCRVKGPVKKGDPLVSYLDGAAISIFNQELETQSSYFVFAKALENIKNKGCRKIWVVIV